MIGVRGGRRGGRQRIWEDVLEIWGEGRCRLRDLVETRLEGSHVADGRNFGGGGVMHGAGMTLQCINSVYHICAAH